MRPTVQRRVFRPERADCSKPGCDRPRHVGPSGRVYDSCEVHHRAWHVAAHRRKVDRALARIAAAERPPLPEVCAACFRWRVATGQQRACRGCLRGLEEAARPDPYPKFEKPGRWTTACR